MCGHMSALHACMQTHCTWATHVAASAGKASFACLLYCCGCCTISASAMQMQAAVGALETLQADNNQMQTEV